MSAAPGGAGLAPPGRLAGGASSASEGVSGWGVSEWSLSEKSLAGPASPMPSGVTGGERAGRGIESGSRAAAGDPTAWRDL